MQLNERAFKKLPGSRRSLFEQVEKSKLVPLPSQSYEYLNVRNARVHVDYHVEYDKHYYSVPHMLVGYQVEMRASNRIVNIYSGGKRVACHTRSHVQAGHTTLSEHMPQSHRHQADWTPESLMNWSSDIGPSTLHIVSLKLKARRHPEQSYRSVMGLLALAKQYDRVRLERACARALQIGSPTRTSVLSILKKGMDKLPIDTQQEKADDNEHLNNHDNIRGTEYFH